MSKMADKVIPLRLKTQKRGACWVVTSWCSLGHAEVEIK